MKRCPECRRDYYDDSLLYCLDDGTSLLEGPATAEPDEPQTARMDLSATPSHGGSNDRTRSLSDASLAGRRVSRPLIAAIAAVLIVASGFGIYMLSRRSAVPVQRSNANMLTTRLTGDGKVRDAAISPDGKFLAYLRVEGGDMSVWLRQVQTNSNIQIVKPGELDDFYALTFSPDGNYLYFNAAAQGQPPAIYRVSSLGGTPAKVLALGYYVQFSPDGRLMSYFRYDIATSSGGVYIANADGTSEKQLVALDGTKYAAARPAFSPNGKMIAFTAGDDALLPGAALSIMVVSIETLSQETLGERWPVLSDLAWHPSGDSLIVSGSDNEQTPQQIWEVAYPSAERRRLTNDLNSHTSVSITADGNQLVTGELYARSALWVSPDLNPENAKQVTQATADTYGLSWTPDGRIVFASDQSGSSEIWAINPDGTGAVQLTNDRVPKRVPVVSPDGRYIVYSALTYGGELVRMDLTGANPFRYPNVTSADNPEISADSKWLLYSAWSGGLQKVFRIPIDGGEPQVLTPNTLRATEPRMSRDGTRFACFVVDVATASYDRIAIFPADGGEPVQTFKLPPNTNISRGPVWTPDDKGITVVVAPGELQNLWLQPLDGSPGRALTNFALPGVARREYSRDGKRIALMRSEGIGNVIMITGFR